MKQTRIISAFPGTGKTHAFKSGKFDCIDSDSSLFSWVHLEPSGKMRNADFPGNYIAHIKSHIGYKDFIFVSTHEVVRNALRRHCLHFYLIYPHQDLKDEYVRRFKERGSPESFIELVESQFDDWSAEISTHDEKRGCHRWRLTEPHEYLDQVLGRILEENL